MTAPGPTSNNDLLALIGEPFREALDGIDLPMYVVDRGGAVRWANRAAQRLLGKPVGRMLVSLVPNDARSSVQTQLARSLVGGEAKVGDVAVIAADGRRAALRVRSVPIRAGGRTVGVFSLALPVYDARRDSQRDTALTPRQTEVLRLLADGLTTEAVAERLGIAVETARNHIRAVLRRLDAHSRLEAVVEARQRGLLDD
jgi:PAS domain S-box-containing protein